MGDSWGDRAFSIVFHSAIKKIKKPLELGRVRVRQSSDFIEESNCKKSDSVYSDNPQKQQVNNMC